MINSINLHDGVITYNGIDGIDFDQLLEPQQDVLDEDLLQISYGEHHTVDVGWCPSFDLSGSIIIRVIKNSNWEEPILEKEPEKSSFLKALQECIDFAAEQQKKAKS